MLCDNFSCRGAFLFYQIHIPSLLTLTNSYTLKSSEKKVSGEQIIDIIH